MVGPSGQAEPTPAVWSPAWLILRSATSWPAFGLLVASVSCRGGQVSPRPSAGDESGPEPGYLDIDALGGEGLAEVARDVQTGHRERFMADWMRFGATATGIECVDDADLGSELRSLEHCAEGSFESGLFDFYAA